MGSVKWRTIKRADKSEYEVLRAQYHHPHGPGDRPRNYEQTLNPNAPKYKALGDLRKRRRACERDAAKWVDENEQAIANGTWRDPDAPMAVATADDDSPTVAEVVAEWIGTWDKADKTKSSYLSILRPATVKDEAKRAKPAELYVVGRWGDQPITVIKRNDIQQWLDALKAKGYAAQTQHNAYNVARGLFGFAVAEGYIESRDNPTGRDTGMRLPSKAAHHEEMLFCEPDELRALVEAMTPWWRPAVWIDGLMGMRAGELWALTIADVDLKHHEVSISKAIKDQGHLSLGPTKTHARRVVDIPEACLSDFKTLLARPGVYLRGVRGPNARPDHKPIKGYAAVVDGALGGVEDASDPRRLLFTLPGGQVVSEANFLNRELRPAVRRAVEAGTLSKTKFFGPQIERATGKPKLDDNGDPIIDALLRTHDLRHSAAAIALDSLGATNGALYEVSQMLGHASVDTTTRLYGHRTRAGRKRLADAISANVKSGSK